MSKVKSRAASLLEKIQKVQEDETPAAEIPAVKPDVPLDGAPAADQPDDKKPEVPAPALQEELIDQPDKMAGCLKSQEEMCGKYEDEGDSSCFTPQSDDDKKMVSEAKYHIREARSRMLKLKR